MALGLPKWRDYDKILHALDLIIFARGVKEDEVREALSSHHGKLTYVDWSDDVSSTVIRQKIAK